MKWFSVINPKNPRIVIGAIYGREGKIRYRVQIRLLPFPLCQDCGVYAATFKQNDVELCNYCADRPYHINAEPYDPLKVRVIKDNKIVKEYRISNEEYHRKICKEKLNL